MRFALVDRLAAAFRGVEGFAPYTFVFYAYSPSIVDGSWDRPGITRSLRYDPEGPSSWIRVHGTPRIAWHRRVVGGLERAGYTRTLRLKNETVCQRWLPTRRECLAELQVVAEIADEGPPSLARMQTAPWSRGAGAPRSPTLLEALEAARSAPIPWGECALGFARRERLHGELQGLSLLVGVVGFQDRDGQRFENYVSVFAPSSSKRAIAGIERSARRELREAGYRLGRGPLFGTKQASTARGAVGECKKVLSSFQASLVDASTFCSRRRRCGSRCGPARTTATSFTRAMKTSTTRR